MPAVSPPAASPPRPIATFAAGDAVVGFALVRRREERRDKAGKSYLDLELADASGAIAAKAWSDSAALGQRFAAGEFVKFKGTVQSYREQLQLKLDHCRPVTEADRADGFDEALVVPSTREDVDALWRRLGEALAADLARPEAKRLAEAALARHGEVLRLHPAAKSIHHAVRGGLLEHTVSMVELARRVAAHYPELDRDLLLLGVLFHDLGKLLELGATPGSDYTQAGRLVGHIVLGRDLARELAREIPQFPADLLLRLEHLILAHQGQFEFGSPVLPALAEAIALHAIDDLDSKLAVLRDLARAQRGFVWVRSLDRYVWLGDDGAPAAAPGAGEPAENGEPAPDPTPPFDPPQKRIW
jgi:3'-5' exoribonuclease